MDVESYEQFSLDREILGDTMNYVKENDEVEVTFHEGTAIGIRLPAKVELVITRDRAGRQGRHGQQRDEARDASRPGFVVKVPTPHPPGRRTCSRVGCSKSSNLAL